MTFITLASRKYIPFLFSILNLNAIYSQLDDFTNIKCNKEYISKRMDTLSILKYSYTIDEIKKRHIRKEYDSLDRLILTTWHFDMTFYRDTHYFDAWQEKLKREGKSFYWNPPNLCYTPPQLSQSRIAGIEPFDSMSFYYFTWYTIKADWEAAKWRGNFGNGLVREADADINGDLPDGLWHWYDSMGYNRVYMLRKLVLKRTPCKWIIHASKDIFFTPDRLKPAIDSFNLMMQDGKERFRFEYENTYAQTMTANELEEWNYPLDYLGKKRNVSIMNGQRYLQNVIWEYAKIELNQRQAKEFKLSGPWWDGRNRNLMTNNFIVKFSDGTFKSYYLPFWFYIHKYYIRQWQPGEGK